MQISIIQIAKCVIAYSWCQIRSHRNEVSIVIPSLVATRWIGSTLCVQSIHTRVGSDSLWQERSPIYSSQRFPLKLNSNLKCLISPSDQIHQLKGTYSLWKEGSQHLKLSSAIKNFLLSLFWLQLRPSHTCDLPDVGNHLLNRGRGDRQHHPPPMLVHSLFNIDSNTDSMQ